MEQIIKYSSKLRLLYVEDNKEARESTLGILEEFFKSIIVAVDGSEGLEKFKENKVDIIITDINMPKINGLKMIEKIRELDKDIYILVLSAYNESGFFMDSIRLGVEGYLLKPIDLEQFLGVLSKITQKVSLQEKAKNNLSLLNQYQEATDNALIVSKTDLKGNITYVNDEFCKISEYSREELLGKNHNIIRHPENQKDMYEDLWDTIKNKKKIYKATIRNISKNGHVYYLKTTIKPILDIDGNVFEYIALRDDITSIMSPRKQLDDFISFTKNPILFLLEIVDYKNMEKFYGYPKIDEIETKISKKILELIPQNCRISKIFILNNGRFALVKDAIRDVEIIISGMKVFLQNLNANSLQIDNNIYDISMHLSVSYEANIFDNCTYGLDELKESGFDFIIANHLAEAEKQKAKNNLSILEMVHTAIKSYKIVSYFQPIVNNKTKTIVKYESLVRLIDKDNKIISPFFFLNIAKQGRFYTQITKIVLQNSFDALNKTDKDISINLSAIDIEKESVLNTIFELLEKYKVHSSRIIFELLEDESIKNMQTVKDFITKVKSYGVKIAIDDFGTGYSNFERLVDYQPDILKIDASLIKNILKDNYSLSVVKTIVAFAKTQSIQVVGEFVESKEVYELLTKLGIEFSQGYYFGKPEPLLENIEIEI